MNIHTGSLHIKPPKQKKHLSFSALRKILDEVFSNIPDTRDEKKIRHTIHDVLMSGFAMMFFREPSLLQFQKNLQDHFHTNNLKTIFNVSTIPKDTQMRDVIDNINPSYLYPIFKRFFIPLQRGKYLKRFYTFLDKYYLVTIDGSSYFSSEKIHCPYCLFKKIRKKKKNKNQKNKVVNEEINGEINEEDSDEYTIRYEHQILQAALVHPDVRQVIPLAPEFIMNSDIDIYDTSISDASIPNTSISKSNSSSDSTITSSISSVTTSITPTNFTTPTTTPLLPYVKQDCEINAAKRLIERLRKDHPKLNMVIVGDALYSKEPFIRKLKRYKYHYILSVKEADHKTLMEWIREQEYLKEVSKKEIIHIEGKKKKKKKGYIYRWINNMPLTDREDTTWVNYFELTIHDYDKDYVTYHASWITDLQITDKNIQELVRGARARWKIENECFNTLKNQGYHIEHNYGHGTRYLSTNFFLLNLIAFFMHQIFELTDKLYNLLKEKAGTRERLWEKLRAIISTLVFKSWDALIMGLYNPEKINLYIVPP